MVAPKINSLSQCRVFFDFDNTLTSFDVLDQIIERFSVDKKWVALEEKWKDGAIGSRACLKGQLRSVRISRKNLLAYLRRVKINPYFKKLLFLLKNHSAGPVILSDDFHFVIDSVLSNNGIKGVRVQANNLRFRKDILLPTFPHTNKSCWKCAHCKTKNLQKGRKNSKIIIYVGDGYSDICPAQKADIVFAKGNLLKHFRANKLSCNSFHSLRDVYDYFKKIHESENR